MKFEIGTTQKPMMMWLGVALTLMSLNTLRKATPVGLLDTEVSGYYLGSFFTIAVGVGLALWGYYGIRLVRK